MENWSEILSFCVFEKIDISLGAGKFTKYCWLRSAWVIFFSIMESDMKSSYLSTLKNEDEKYISRRQAYWRTNEILFSSEVMNLELFSL